MKPDRLRLVLCAVAMFGGVGCCGVSADPTTTANGTAVVDSGGTVHFKGIQVGTVESFAIPVRETADTSETLVSATLTGSGAASFQVLSNFPIDVPDGQDVTVDVQFAPTGDDTFDAELLLQTAKMGTSQIPLVGIGL